MSGPYDRTHEHFMERVRAVAAFRAPGSKKWKARLHALRYGMSYRRLAGISTADQVLAALGDREAFLRGFGRAVEETYFLTLPRTDIPRHRRLP